MLYVQSSDSESSQPRDFVARTSLLSSENLKENRLSSFSTGWHKACITTRLGSQAPIPRQIPAEL